MSANIKQENIGGRVLRKKRRLNYYEEPFKGISIYRSRRRRFRSCVACSTARKHLSRSRRAKRRSKSQSSSVIYLGDYKSLGKVVTVVNLCSDDEQTAKEAELPENSRNKNSPTTELEPEFLCMLYKMHASPDMILSNVLSYLNI